jgi:hypothetical protein
MPLSPDPTSPAALRYSRTPKTLVGATVATTGIATVASGALDKYQTGDLCIITDAAVGTKYTGQANVAPDTVYRIVKLSATTAQLVINDTGVAAAPSVAISAGAALQFGSLPPAQGVLSSNIVAAGSTAGGAFGGPLD